MTNFENASYSSFFPYRRELHLYSSAEKVAARKLLFRLFPRLRGAYFNEGHGADMDGFWAEGKRVAATQYFDRYFTYAIPLGDVSDRDISSLLKLAESGTVDEVVEAIERTVDPTNASTYIGKLRRIEDSCPLEAGLILSQALARSASRFPSDDAWKIFGSRAQVAVFISEVIARIKDEVERVSVATRVITDASTPEVARDLLYWLARPSKNQRREEDQAPILQPPVIDQLNTLVVQRIEREAQQTDILDIYEGLEARSVLYMWAEGSGRGATQAHLQQSMAGRPDKVLKFLSWYTGTGINLSDGRPTWGSFGRESYDSVAALIDPEIIAAQLRAAGFGEVTTDISPTSFEEYLASNFLKIHAAISAEPEDRLNSRVSE